MVNYTSLVRRAAAALDSHASGHPGDEMAALERLAFEALDLLRKHARSDRKIAVDAIGRVYADLDAWHAARRKPKCL